MRRVLLTRQYDGDQSALAPDLRRTLLDGIEAGSLDADEILSAYCTMLLRRQGSFEEVARRTNLDRRTVKKYIDRFPKKPEEKQSSR